MTHRLLVALLRKGKHVVVNLLGKKQDKQQGNRRRNSPAILITRTARLCNAKPLPKLALVFPSGGTVRLDVMKVNPLFTGHRFAPLV